LQSRHWPAALTIRTGSSQRIMILLVLLDKRKCIKRNDGTIVAAIFQSTCFHETIWLFAPLNLAKKKFVPINSIFDCATALYTILLDPSRPFTAEPVKSAVVATWHWSNLNSVELPQLLDWWLRVLAVVVQ
jgi:hypothetical protein